MCIMVGIDVKLGCSIMRGKKEGKEREKVTEHNDMKVADGRCVI